MCRCSGTDLALWGADGTYEGSSRVGGAGGKGGFGTSGKLGVDLVLAIPEPTTGVLIGLGLVAIGTVRRTRRAV